MVRFYVPNIILESKNVSMDTRAIVFILYKFYISFES